MTRSVTYGPFKFGIDNITPDGFLDQGAVRDAVNVDLDNVGNTSSRPGYTFVYSQARLHSGWRSRLTGRSYCMQDGWLCRVRCNGVSVTAIPLGMLASNEPVSFEDLDDRIVFTNVDQIGCIIGANDMLYPLGVENPPIAPTVAGVTGGSLGVGDYELGYAYVNSLGEESGMSEMTRIGIGVGNYQGLQWYGIPQPKEPTTTRINLYRTDPGDRIMKVAASVPVGTTSYLMTDLALGRPANNLNQERMHPGRLVRVWNGYLLVALEDEVSFSPGFHYGRWAPEDGSIPFSDRVTLLEPVRAGWFVGGSWGVRFLEGNKPMELRQVERSSMPPNPYSGTRVKPSDFGGDVGRSSDFPVLWMSGNGFVMGLPDGTFLEPQQERFLLPAAHVGAAATIMVKDRRALAVMQ